MTSNQSEQLSRVILVANAINDETLAGFGGLTAMQLNWKPGADRWSVAQCFDHLLNVNGGYFPIFDKVVSGEKRSTFWERLPWLPTFWGKMLLKAVDPESKRKLKAPKVFQPSTSNVAPDVIRRFIDQQNQVVRYMKATEELDLEKIRITSPAINLVTYSLMDAYRIIVAHEKRHLLQAKRATEMEGFPKEMRGDLSEGVSHADLPVQAS